MKYLTNINLFKNELQNARIQNLATPPNDPVIGQIYFNTGDQELYVFTSGGWDVVGKEYSLADDILKASESENVLKYSPHSVAAAGVFSSTNATVAGTNALAYSGHLYVNRLNDLELARTTHGFTIYGANTNDKGIIFNNSASWTGNLTLSAWSNSELRMFKNLYVGSSTDGSGTITLRTETNESPTLIIGPNATANTVAIFNTNGALTSLATGSNGQTLRVVNDIPTWTTGGSTDQSLTLTFEGGTTENTNQYTFDGATAKAINFIGGTDISISAATNAITLNHSNVTRTNSSNSATPGFTGTFDVIDSITTSPTGHVTGVNTKTVTMPTETQLSKVDSDVGVWISNIEVSDHQITVSRTNTTNATIQVGELVVSTAGAGNGNLTVGGNATITGNLTVNGTITTINTETLEIKDNIIEINSNQTGTPPSNLVSGIEVNRGDEANYQFVFVEQTDDFRLGKIGSLQPVLTRDEVGNLGNGDVLVWDATDKKAITQTFDQLNLPNKFAGSVNLTNGTFTYNVVHSLDTTDVIVSVKDITASGTDTKDQIVYTDVKIIDADTIQIIVGNFAPIETLRVTVIG